MQTRVKLINNEDAYNTNYTIEMHAIKLRQTSSICLGPILTYYRPILLHLPYHMHVSIIYMHMQSDRSME